jgi:hypothetical protein
VVSQLAPVLDFIVLFVGCFAFLRGTWGIIWEFWSWAVLGTAGERVLLVGSDPRIRHFAFYIVQSSGGLAVVLWVLSRVA